MNPHLEKQKKVILQKIREANSFTLLFICSGNIIRSPYAHLLFEHLIQEDRELKEKIRVESRGVTYRNYYISMEAREMLLKEGISAERIAEFTPRYFSDYPDVFKSADLVLVMENNHIRRVPISVRKQTFLLLEFTLGVTDDVPDPYFDPPFERSFQMVKEAMIQLRTFFRGG